MDTVEWLPLAAGISVIARADGRFSVYRAGGFDPIQPYAQPRLAGRGARDGTRALLTGALMAGLRRAETAPPPPPSLPRVVYRLCGRYQTTHATPPAFQRVAARFRAAGRDDLASFAETKAREETGHDRLVLMDLQALGLPTKALVEAVRPPTAVALVAHLAELEAADHPIGVFGYAYALERAALSVDQAQIDATQAVCPPGVDATRGMRVHSSVGADRDHVRAMVNFVATLAAAERAEIARAVYSTACIMAGDVNPADDAILEDLQQAGGIPLSCS